MTASGWVSAYCFVPTPIYSAECDRVVLDVLPRLTATCRAADWISGYFFVRYREQGAHLRVRLRARERATEPLLEDALRSIPAMAGSVVSSVQFVAYEPEYERYGGRDGMPIAEAQFEASSDAVLAALRACAAQPHSAKLGKAVLGMIATTHPFCATPGVAAAFFRRYADEYLKALAGEADVADTMRRAFDGEFVRQTEQLVPYIVEAWRRHASGESVSAWVDDYAIHMRRTRDRLAARDATPETLTTPNRSSSATQWRVLPSYLHMFNNRLGVSIPEESYLAHLVSRALSADD